MQHAQMPLHRIHVAPDDRSAERPCRAERGVVGQRLQQNRNHSLPRRFPGHARRNGNLFGSNQKPCQQWRRKRSPRMICSLVFLANRIREPSHVLNHATCHAHCARIPLNGERNSYERRSGPPHKRHQRMHRRHRRSPPAQSRQFIAAKRTAGVHRNSSLPFDCRRQQLCRRGNGSIRHAEPYQPCLDSCQIRRRASTHLLSQPPRLP